MFRHLFHRRSSTLQYRVLTSDDRTSDDEADPLPELHADCVTREEIGQEDLTNLRRVPDSLPASAWLITLMEMCERFAFFGLSGPLQNYIQNSKDDPLRPGALGLGQAAATRLNQCFVLWCYLTPIGGAVLADQYIGRFKTIMYSALIYIAGLVLLFITSLPSQNSYRVSLGGLLTAMVLIGIGTGGIKPNANTLVAGQYRGTTDTLRTLKSGEIVILDPNMTIQRIYMILYFCVNIGSTSSIATTEFEQKFGFWAAFLLPLLAFSMGYCVLLTSKNIHVTQPAEGSIVLKAFKVFWMALKHNGALEAAKPSYQESLEQPESTPWDDLFVNELRRTLVACKVFLFFPFYWAAYSQLLTNFISQAGTMETHGIPNDIMTNLVPLAVIFLIPIFEYLVYPVLRRIGLPLRPITRITWGFFFCSFAMAYAAIVQHLIYQSPPCYDHPLARNCLGGTVPNQVHVAIQTPAYLFIALSEILAIVTGLEYAYTKAPASMKSFVMALFLSTVALGAILAIFITPFAINPQLVWMYSGLSVQVFVVGMVFWLIFKKYNRFEVEMNALGAEES